jgi:DNA-binding response OmpR family regulator
MPRILLIDKGTSSVHNFKKSLAKKKYELTHAQDIKTALRFLRNNDVDLIVIDLENPSTAVKSTEFTENTADQPKI